MFPLWGIWIIVGVVLLIAEIFTQGIVLGVLGVSCFASAALSVANVGLGGQLIGFCTIAAIMFIVVRPLIMKYLWRHESGESSNVEALIGTSGFVTEEIDHIANTGRVKIGGEEWSARANPERLLEKGNKVIVVGISGCKVIVSETD